MSDAPRFHLVRVSPVEPSVYAATTRCQGTRCGRVIEPGELVHHVVRVADFARDPADTSGRAYLCAECVGTIDPLEDIRDRERAPLDFGPPLRGKPLPDF